MVSANNKPLAEFGIIERAKGGLYGLTERGVEVARSNITCLSKGESGAVQPP
jgi:hypothetical protein